MTGVKAKQIMVLPPTAGQPPRTECVLIGKTKDGYCVVDPATGERFHGTTEDEAMENYCKGVSMDANSKIAYRDSKGVVQHRDVVYSPEKRYVDIWYRLAVAAVIIGTVVGSGGSATGFWIATAGGAFMAITDTGELIYKAANGQEISKGDVVMVAVDIILSVVLPGAALAKTSKAGRAKAIVKFLEKQGVNVKKTVKDFKNTEEYLDYVTDLAKKFAKENPEAFVKALKLSSKDVSITSSKYEKVYVEVNGKLEEVATIKTKLSQADALKYYEKEIAEGKIISGKGFVLAKDGAMPEKAFHLHPTALINPADIKLGETITGTKQIEEVLTKTKISYEDIFSAATGDGKVRIICKKAGGGYVAVEAEITITEDGQKIIKNLKVKDVAFAEGKKVTGGGGEEMITEDEISEIAKRIDSKAYAAPKSRADGYYIVYVDPPKKAEVLAELKSKGAKEVRFWEDPHSITIDVGQMGKLEKTVKIPRNPIQPDGFIYATRKGASKPTRMIDSKKFKSAEDAIEAAKKKLNTENWLEIVFD